MTAKITLLQDDISCLLVDAVVNAARSSLLGGGGVDGAIHRAAGPELLAACKTLGGCETGKAKITHGFMLPAKFVIHTVGPIWQGGGKNEAVLLASCYQQALQLASENGVRSIAFPAISCGAYGFPRQQACNIAVKTVLEELPHHPNIRKVIFCALDPMVHEYLLAEIGKTQLH
jgi:O-acetyl-ADP-ribose deacetylase (regulator of RNase III)